jgi:hypothetical protein
LIKRMVVVEISKAITIPKVTDTDDDDDDDKEVIFLC